MKTVIAIIGSARRNGITALATRRLLSELQSYGDVRGEIIFLSDYRLEVCRGCKSCFLRGEECCPLKDDRDLLIERMMSSDGIIFASPNYSFQVSAIFKTFLDRLGFVFHRPRFHGKTYTCIVAQGIHGGGKIVKYLEFVGSSLGFNVVKGSCVSALEPMSERERSKINEAMAKQGRRFHERLLRPAYPVPSLAQLMLFRMARTSIKLMLGADNRDYTYYRDHGWFESGYYFPVHLGPVSKRIGAAADWIADRMFRHSRSALVVSPSKHSVSGGDLSG